MDLQQCITRMRHHGDCMPSSRLWIMISFWTNQGCLWCESVENYTKLLQKSHLVVYYYLLSISSLFLNFALNDHPRHFGNQLFNKKNYKYLKKKIKIDLHNGIPTATTHNNNEANWLFLNAALPLFFLSISFFFVLLSFSLFSLPFFYS